MRVLILGVVLVFVTACASRSSLRSLPEDAGETRLFAGDVRGAALAARNAIVATSLEVVEVEQRGSHTWHLIAFGPGAEYVRVLCEQIDEDIVAVRIAVRRSDVFSGRSDWGPTLFAQLLLELEAVDLETPTGPAAYGST